MKIKDINLRDFKIGDIQELGDDIIIPLYLNGELYLNLQLPYKPTSCFVKNLFGWLESEQK